MAAPPNSGMMQIGEVAERVALSPRAKLESGEELARQLRRESRRSAKTSATH